jgi:hypothetical protein
MLMLMRSDLLAELDLPHSGIAQLEEGFSLPTGFEDLGMEAVGRDELWYFLAEIALRRLLNRVSSMLYIRTTPYSKGPAATSVAQLDPLVVELDYQLNQWYAGLPQAMQFPLDRVPLQNPVLLSSGLMYCLFCKTKLWPWTQVCKTTAINAWRHAFDNWSTSQRTMRGISRTCSRALSRKLRSLCCASIRLTMC